MHKLIAFTGRKGSGKDSAARILYEHGFVQIKLAGPLKNMLRAYYEYLGESPDKIERRIEGDLKELPTQMLCGKSTREGMQTLGTEWGRDLIGKDIWLNAFEKKVSLLNKVVCTDLRFPNEAEFIRKMGGHIIYIERALFDEDGYEPDHPSETLVDSVWPDFTLHNNRSILELQKDVLELFEEQEWL